LVLHGGDGTTSDPVDGVSVGLFEDGDLLCEAVIINESENGLVLGGRPVGELVVASLPVGTAVVVVLNPVVDIGEDADTHGELLNISDHSVELSHVAKIVEADNAGHCDKV
jgi:hypothetical protein